MARPAKKIESEPGDIEFFSEIDMNTVTPDKIGSTYPSWFFNEQQRLLEEDIVLEEHMLKSPALPEASRPVKAAKIKKMKERLEKIREAQAGLKPNVDKLSVMAKELSEILPEVMYRRGDEKRGLVSPHKVAEQMVTPCIKVSSEIARTASINGMQVSKGMMNLNDATRLWQISRKALGEDSNVEVLRKD